MVLLDYVTKIQKAITLSSTGTITSEVITHFAYMEVLWETLTGESTNFMSHGIKERCSLLETVNSKVTLPSPNGGSGRNDFIRP